jgi:Protein of unknown function (DUF3833)
MTSAEPTANPRAPNTVERFELPLFLAGTTKAWGIFEDRFGRLRRRFDVEIHGSWQGDVFRLDEKFLYDDGRVEQRVWLVKPVSPGRFDATCDDCIGVASGTYLDGQVHMSYAFRLRLPSRVINVDIDDRLYRINAYTAVNRSTVRKWGVRIGEISMFFERQPKPSSLGLPDQPVREAAE